MHKKKIIIEWNHFNSPLYNCPDDVLFWYVIFIDALLLKFPAIALFKFEVIKLEKLAAFGELTRAVSWSEEKPAIWLDDNELTVDGGIYVQALDDIELIDFNGICAMSAGDIPALDIFL